MATVLLATDSVHTTAAACDYLGSQLDGDDTVLVLSIPADDVSERDTGDATNVARTRLIEPAVEILDSPDATGTIAEQIHAVAVERAVDSIVVGTHRGDPETASDPPGSTTRKLLAMTTQPVVVVPV